MALVIVLSSLASAATVILARVLLKAPVSRPGWMGLAAVVGGLILIHLNRS